MVKFRLYLGTSKQQNIPSYTVRRERGIWGVNHGGLNVREDYGEQWVAKKEFWWKIDNPSSFQKVEYSYSYRMLKVDHLQEPGGKETNLRKRLFEQPR